MKIFTIGFTQKRARQFFELIRQNGIQRLVDIRLRPGGQLSGFAKQEDLPYFLEKLADNCQYIHLPELAPTREILDDYRSHSDWELYAQRFEALMDERNIPALLNRIDFEDYPSCLLCSEPTPVKCHRRLVAERLASFWVNAEIIHL